MTRNCDIGARLAGLGLALALGSQAMAVQTITGHIVCDNFYELFVGSQPQWVEGGSLGQCPFGFQPPPVMLGSPLNGPQTPPLLSFTFTDTGSYLYIVAWSDDSSQQGMLVDIMINGQRVTTLSPFWEVYATGDDRDTLAQAPTMADVFNQIALADTASGPATSSRGWVRPSLGGCNTGMFPPGSPWNQYPAVAAGISWMWYDSGQQSGGFPPFSPGFNHKEYLIFRYPLCRGLPCAGDLNGDGVVNGADLALLLGSWGPCP